VQTIDSSAVEPTSLKRITREWLEGGYLRWILPSCGHWTQQERAEEVNAGIIDFLRQL